MKRSVSVRLSEAKDKYRKVSNRYFVKYFQMFGAF